MRHRHRRSRDRFYDFPANRRDQASQQFSWTNPVVKSPFDDLPFKIAGGFRHGFSQPLGQAFMLGDTRSPAYTRFQNQMSHSTGPLADFIRRATGISENYIPSMTSLAPELESNARATYGGYQNAVDNFMQQLPGFESSAANATAGGTQALDYARTAAEDAFSPLQSRASFQEASRRALTPAREGAAARGMLEGGQAQAGEQSLISDLAFKALQGDREAQQQAIGGLTGAATGVGSLTGNQAAIAGLGPEMRKGLFEALPGLTEALKGARGLPMEAANTLLGFLTSTQQPNMALLKYVLPTVTQKSFSGGGSAGVCDMRAKEEVAADVPGLDAVLTVEPISFQYLPELALEPGRHYGFSAQEIAKVAPLAVVQQGTYLAIDYRALVPILFQAIRDLSSKVAALEARHVE